MSFDKVEVRVFSGPDQVQVGSNTEPDLIVMNIGPKGDAGNAATVAVGTTTTGAAGSSASVTNSGTTSAAVFNFTIPRGDTGAAGASGGSSTAWRYRAKTNATSGYPTNGHLLWNNATQTSATEILVSHLDDEGSDIELLLSFFLDGQKIFIQNRDDSSQNQVWEINGTPTVTGANTSTAYYTFPVTLVSSAGAAFTNNHSILFGSIAAAVNAVTSATTSDGTAILDVESIKSQFYKFPIQTSADDFEVSPVIIPADYTGTETEIDIEAIYKLPKYPLDEGLTTLARTPNEDGSININLDSTSDGTGQIMLDTLAVGTCNITDEVVFDNLAFTYGTGAAAAHRTALGLTTLATTTPAANVATFLATPTSANLAAAVTDENGTGGGFVRAEGATLTTPTFTGSAARANGQNAVPATSDEVMTRGQCDSRIGKVSVMSADVTVVSSTTPVPLTVSSSTHPDGLSELGFTLAANKTYAFEFIGEFYEETSPKNQLFTLAGPSGASFSSRIIAGASGSTAVYQIGGGSTVSNLISSGAFNGMIKIYGLIKMGATSGNVTLRFSQNSSTANPTTIKKGSTMILFGGA